MTAMEEEEPPTRPLSDRSAHDSVRESSSQIEGEIAATRAKLSETLGALERRLAPRQLLGSGVDMLKDVIIVESSRFNKSLRGQPLPLALIVVCVGWLLVSQRTRPRAPLASHRADEWARELAGEARGSVADRTSAISDSSDYAASQKSGDAMGKPWVVTPKGARSAPSQPGHRVSGLIDQRPLAFGVLGILVGATVALMLPRSAAEERVIGPAGERLREEAANLGREAIERVHHVAESAADAAAEAARHAINGAGESIPRKRRL